MRSLSNQAILFPQMSQNQTVESSVACIGKSVSSEGGKNLVMRTSRKDYLSS